MNNLLLSLAVVAFILALGGLLSSLWFDNYMNNVDARERQAKREGDALLEQANGAFSFVPPAPMLAFNVATSSFILSPFVICLFLWLGSVQATDHLRVVFLSGLSLVRMRQTLRR